MAARLAPQRNFITITQMNASDRTSTATTNSTTSLNEMALASTAGQPNNAPSSLSKLKPHSGHITIVNSAECKIITITSPGADQVDGMDEEAGQTVDPLCGSSALHDDDGVDEDEIENVEHEVIDENGVSCKYRISI